MSPLPLVAKALSYGSRTRASIFIAGLALLILALPDQTLELYVIYAQALIGIFGASQTAQASASDNDARLVMQFAYGILATVALSALLWAATVRQLEATDQADDKPPLVPRARHEITATAIGLIPAVAVLVGFWQALSKLGSGDRGAAALLTESVWLIGAGTAIVGLVLLNTAIYAAFIRKRALPLFRTFFSGTGLVASAVLLVLVIAALMWRPVHIPAAIGTLAIVAIFLGFLAYFLTIFTCTTERYKVPVVTPLLLLAALFAWTDLNDNHRARHEPRSAIYPAVESEFLAWFRTRQDRSWYESRGLPYPIYIVSAEGGGLYAGYHAATFLARLQDQCPAFSHHTFAISSVSGGSLGAAVFSLAAGRTAGSAAPAPCSDRQEAGPNSRLVRRFFANDFLSPLVAAALFPDFLQRFLPFPVGPFDRARALESAFEEAWQDAVEAEASSGSLPEGQHGTAINEFAQPIGEIGGRGKASVPLFLNTTAVATGARVTLAPFSFEATPTAFHLQSSLGAAVDIPLSVAVSLSARFPLVTPVGWLERPPPAVAADGTVLGGRSAYGNRLYLADGGYFENSGLETAIELSMRLRRVIERHPEVFPNGAGSAQIKIVKIMAGDRFAVRWWSQDADMSHAGAGELLSPLAVLLNTRRARTRAVDSRTMFDGSLYRYSPVYRDPTFAEYAVTETGRIGYVPGYYRVMLDGTSYFLPLGWHLSTTTRGNIEHHGHYISAFSRCMIRLDLSPSEQTGNERINSCVTETSAAARASNL